MRIFTKSFAVLLLFALMPAPTAAVAAEREQLLGAGATFPLPFYHAVFDLYGRQHGVRVTYQGIGSGGGIQQLIERKIDFGGTDAYMDTQEAQQAAAPVLHVPTCLGAVALTYNLPGNPALKLTPELIADIFLGTIRRWNDPRLAGLNPESRLPDLGISVIHRSDSSGTTFIFTEYLSKISSEWKRRVGTGKSLSWPASTGAAGNPGVAGQVKQTPGAIGYVELIYALGNDLTVASVRNRAGRYIAPTPESVTLAAAVPLPDDMHVSLTDTSAPDGYPISGFTYLILYREQDYAGRSRNRAETLAHLLSWVTHEGQKHAATLQYAPLAEAAVRKAEGIIRFVTYHGQPVLRDR